MKRIFSILALFISFLAAGQYQEQAVSNPKTLYYGRGLLGADSGYVYRRAYADTTAANLGNVDLIPGATIRTTGDLVWIRSDAANKWVYVGGAAGGGGGGGTNIYNSDGTLLGDRVVNMAGNSLVFNNAETGGFVVYNDAGSETRFKITNDVSELVSTDLTNGIILYNDSTKLIGLGQSFYQTDSMLVRTASEQVLSKEMTLLVEDNKPNEWLIAASMGLPFKTPNSETVTLSSAEGYIHDMIFANGFVFAITRDVPKKVVKFNNPNDLSDYDLLELAEDDYDGGYDLSYIPYKRKLYAAMSMEDSILIAEIDPVTFTYTVVARKPHTFHSPVGLAFDNTYLYVLTSNGVSGQGQILRYNTSTWAESITTLTTVGAVPHALGFDGINLFVGEQASPGKLYKITPSTMAVAASVTFATGDNNPTDDMAFAGDYVWVGLETSSGFVLKIKKSDLSITRVNTGSASQSYGLHFDGTYVWNTHNSSPGVLTRIDPQALEIWKYTMATGENSTNELITDGQRLFVSCYIEPSKVVRLTMPTLTYVSGGSTTTVTASNGLTASSNNITLGGTLTQNTTIAAAGFDYNISNSATSMLLEIEPKEFQYYAEDPATSSFRYVDIQARADLKRIYLQTAGNEKSALVQIDSTTGVTNFAFNNATLHQSHIKVRADSMEIHAYNGTIHMDTLKTATVDTAQAKPTVWNRHTGRFEVYPYWPGGGGAIPTFQQTLTAGSTLTTDNTVDADGNDFAVINGSFVGMQGTSGQFIAGSDPNYSGLDVTSSTQADLQVVVSSLSTSSVSVRTDSVLISAGNSSVGHSQLKVKSDTILINPGLGNLYIDSLTEAAGTHTLRYDPTTGLVSYDEIPSGGGTVTSFAFTDGSGFDGTVTNATTTPTLALTTSLTQGSVAFIGASGALSQDNNALFWDNTLKFLGINTTASPDYPLDVVGDLAEDYVAQIYNNNNGAGLLVRSTATSGSLLLELQGNGTTSVFSVTALGVIYLTGDAGTAGQVLTSNGTLAAATWEDPAGGGLTVGTTTIASGTVGRVLFEGSGNVLQEDAGMTYATATDRFTLTGNVDGSVNGVLYIAGTGTGTTGTGLMIDGTNEAGGEKFAIFVSGSTATPGAGTLAILDPSYGYNLLIKPNGEWIFDADNDKGDYRFQFNGYGLIQNTNATDAGIPLTIKGSDGQSVSLQEWHSNGGTVLAAMSQNGKMSFDATITGGGTTGNQTINKAAGSVNFAAAATSLTVTNSLVSANSFVFAVVQTNDGTAYIKNVVPGAGSFVITLGAAATAETRVAFWVIN